MLHTPGSGRKEDSRSGGLRRFRSIFRSCGFRPVYRGHDGVRRLTAVWTEDDPSLSVWCRQVEDRASERRCLRSCGLCGDLVRVARRLPCWSWICRSRTSSTGSEKTLPAPPCRRPATPARFSARVSAVARMACGFGRTPQQAEARSPPWCSVPCQQWPQSKGGASRPERRGRRRGTTDLGTASG
jgi:hypothetical protein